MGFGSTNLIDLEVHVKDEEGTFFALCYCCKFTSLVQKAEIKSFPSLFRSVVGEWMGVVILRIESIEEDVMVLV